MLSIASTRASNAVGWEGSRQKKCAAASHWLKWHRTVVRGPGVRPYCVTARRPVATSALFRRRLAVVPSEHCIRILLNTDRRRLYCSRPSRQRPRAGSGVLRTDPLRFLAGCRTRRLNQAQSVYHILTCCITILWFIRAHFYVLLVFVAMCSVFWLFWLSCHYLPSDWLERLL